MAHSHDYMYDLNRRFQSVSLLTDRGGAATYFDRIVGNYFDSVLPFSTSPDVTPARLQSCFQSISQIYRSSLRGTGTRPDWSDAGNRRAYIHRFFMMHSYMVYRGLQLSLAGHMYLTESWRGQDNLRVCCIGGGPGSDVVGLAKFLQDRTLIPLERLKCAIGDAYTEWEVDWIRISRANPYDFPFGVTYLHGNVTTINSCLTPVGLITIRSADIITMVKFYSTVAAFMRVNAAHGNLLREIFREMKPGALVLYIDNCYSDQHGEFRRLAQSGGVSECLFEWHGEMSLPIVGHSASISRVSRAIGVEPMQRCKVSLMLLRKPARQYPSRILGDRPYFQY